MSLPSPAPKLFNTHLDLDEAIRTRMVKLLNSVLAALIDLKYQSKQAHWNVKGMQFYPLHELFDRLASELEGEIDEVAERITTLGGYAFGTVRDAAEHSILPEYPESALLGKDHLDVLVDRFAIAAKQLRRLIDEADKEGDKGTADMFTQLSQAMDKRLWLLESHLF